jgi:hypothetical protein
VSREQVERGVDITEALGINQPVLSFSRGALGLMEKPSEILAGCLPISRLVSATDDDVQAGPAPLAKIAAPSCEKRVQLFELNAHGQLCSLERV